MALSNRASRGNKKGFLSSFDSIQNSRLSHETWKQRRLRQYFQRRVLACLVIGVGLFYVLGSKTSSKKSQTNSYTPPKEAKITESNYSVSTHINSTEIYDFDTGSDPFSDLNEKLSKPVFSACSSPRIYPDIKYYQLDAPLDEQPSFLTKEAQYIRGKVPFILKPLSKKKLCIDSSEWEEEVKDRLKFSDGQNPSVMSLSTKSNQLTDKSPRLSNVETIEPLMHIVGGVDVMQNMFAGVIYVGGAQCAFGMPEEEKELFKFSPLEKPPTERSLFLVLDQHLDTVIQSTILIEKDTSKWGKKKFEDSELNDREVVKLDDPRLFFHQGELWILYRNGNAFGFEKQIHNKLHFDLLEENETEDEKLVVFIKASETVTTCCGRNMAMISEPAKKLDESILKTVTWVDPLTVDIAIDPSSKESQKKKKLPEKKKKQPKSDIHGTNGYMIPLLETSEYLGIAHFHRPEHRSKSEFALHGHHYTHAFFTISMDEPHSLKRLSNEFLFESLHPKKENVDGEVIQFASGLDIIAKTNSSSLEADDLIYELMISYGVNDCESAVISLDLNEVQDLLLEVADEDEVFDIMNIREDM